MKPAKTLEDLEDKKWLQENSNVLVNMRNPNRGTDQETMQNLQERHAELRNHMEVIKSNLDDIQNE